MARSDVLSYRLEAQGLNSEPGTVDPVGIEMLDYGVQDTGPDGARWALANRGVDPLLPSVDPDLALAWTLRGAPHLYRRQELPLVAAAVRPFSSADAGKRIFDAAKPLKAAGIDLLRALDEVAAAERKIVVSPMVKGELSTRLTAVMDEPYLRFCKPCNATHLYEMPFRLAAVQAGLELEPGTSPPVLRRVPGWPQEPPAEVPGEAPESLNIIRNYLHFYGPATPKQVSGFLDISLADIKAHWPADAVEVDVEGERRWMLESGLAALEAAGSGGGADGLGDDVSPAVHLLGPFDPYLQAKDRELLVPDAAQRKTLWPMLGRPGAVLAGSDIVGAWRPKTTGKKLTLRIEDFGNMTTAVGAGVEHQAEVLASFRGVTLAGIGQ